MAIHVRAPRAAVLILTILKILSFYHFTMVRNEISTTILPVFVPNALDAVS